MILYACDFYRAYEIDSSVQLVCKYLCAYKNRADVNHGINKLYSDNGKYCLKIIIFKNSV